MAKVHAAVLAAADDPLRFEPVLAASFPPAASPSAIFTCARPIRYMQSARAAPSTLEIRTPLPITRV